MIFKYEPTILKAIRGEKVSWLNEKDIKGSYNEALFEIFYNSIKDFWTLDKALYDGYWFELEVSGYNERDERDDINEIEGMDNSDLLESEIRAKFWLKAHHWESECIAEYNELHLETLTRRTEIFNFAKEFSKQSFPVGETQGGQISGGNHFHIFLNGHLPPKAGNNLFSLLESTPLFAKISLEDQSFHAREVRHWDENNFERVFKDDKEMTDIEIRLNNVIDQRLAGYYISLIWLSSMGVRSLNTLDSDKVGALLKGNQTSFEELQWEREVGLEELDWVSFSEDDMDKIAQNIVIMLDFLNSIGFESYAEWLHSYAKEYKLL